MYRYFFEIASIPFEIKGQTEISIHSSMQPFIVENEEMVDVKYNVVCESNMKVIKEKSIYADEVYKIDLCQIEEGKEYDLCIPEKMLLNKKLFEGSNIWNFLAFEFPLLEKQAFILHSSFVSWKGNGILFTAPSGTGKSTLLSLLAGLDKPQTGKILFKNEDIQKKGYSNHRKNNISLVFQNYNLIDYLSPIENIRLVNKSADESILFELGLDKKQIKRNVMKLSGGQQQRVAIARALVSDAPIILADEPTGNLDSVTAGEIINILKTLAKDRNKCVIVVTHSKEVADSADIILELSGKKLKKVNKMNLEVE